MSACKLCGADVIWCRAETADGKVKSVPVDVKPTPRGTAWFENGRLLFATKARPKPQGVRLFRLHYVDCAGYKAKKELDRKLKGGVPCTCAGGTCANADCAHCADLTFGAFCPATGVPL